VDLSYRKKQFHREKDGQLTTAAIFYQVLSTRFHLLSLINGRKMGRDISLAFNRSGHVMKYLVRRLVCSHVMGNHWRIVKMSSRGKMHLATKVNYQPIASRPCQVSPPALLFPEEGSVPDCAVRVWRAGVNGTVQGGVRGRRWDAWLLLTLGRCLGFVQAVQHICS